MQIQKAMTPRFLFTSLGVVVFSVLVLTTIVPVMHWIPVSVTDEVAMSLLFASVAMSEEPEMPVMYVAPETVSAVDDAYGRVLAVEVVAVKYPASA